MSKENQRSPLAKPLTQADIDAANNLKAIFESSKSKLGLTQTGAAKKLKISQPAVYKYLNGLIPLGAKAVLAWAKLLNVHPSEIRSDFDDLYAATLKPKKVEIVARITDNANVFTPVRDKYIHVPGISINNRGVKALEIKTELFLNYNKGQYVLFDVEQEGNKNRDCVVLKDDTYHIARYDNGKFIDVVTNEELGDDSTKTFKIIGAFFTD